MAVPRVLVLPRFEIRLAGPPQFDVPGKGFELEPGGVAAASEGEVESMFAGAHRVHGKAGIEVAVEGGDRSREAGAWGDHDGNVAVMCPQAVAAARLNRAVIEDVAVHGVDFDIRGVDAGQRDVAIHRLDRDVTARIFDADVALDGVHLDTAAGLGDRKSTRLNSSHLVISYAVFCLKKKKKDSYDHRGVQPHRQAHLPASLSR